MRRSSLLGASVRLGSVFGIPVRLHITFLLLLGWLVLQVLLSGGQGIAGLVLVVALFSFVILHELGHAIMARLCRVETREIVLLPIGGLARLERLPSGLSELVIALAGPAVNLALGLIFLTGGVLLVDTDPATASATQPAVLLWSAAATNFALMAFNLLPAFPMDGGRVLRSLLSLAMPLEQATRWAARTGQAIAIGLVVLGFGGGNPVLVLVGALVFFGAASESFFQTSRARVSHRPALDGAVTRFESVAPQSALGEVAELRLQTGQAVFPVVDAWGRLAGAVTRDTLVDGLSRFGSDAAVLEAMHREVPRAAPEAPLDEVLDQLQNAKGLPVFLVDEDRLVGMVTQQSLGELMEISRALEGHDAATEPPAT
jgi:stage IV sporulation protein FB